MGREPAVGRGQAIFSSLVRRKNRKKRGTVSQFARRTQKKSINPIAWHMEYRLQGNEKKAARI